MSEQYDIAVIGGGPGGYVAAFRAAQLGKKVVLVEKERIGGTCINWGCIPTKYLLHQAKLYSEFHTNKNLDGPRAQVGVNWGRIQKEKQENVDRLVKGIEFLLERNGIHLIRGRATLQDDRQIHVQTKDREQALSSDKIILATGSQPAVLPFITPDGQGVITSRQALELEEIPEALLVIGAGAVGLEIGLIFRKLGAEVSILEILPSILPGADKEMTKRLQRLLKIQGLRIHTQMKIKKLSVEEDKVCLRGVCLRDQKPFEFKGDKALLAVGRTPNSSGFEKIGLPLDESGFVRVDENLETQSPGVYAIGDLIGGQLFAHKASHEGIVAVENACGNKHRMDYAALPMAVYTEPEFSSVGITQEEAKEKNIKIQVGSFSLQASGRALTLGQSEGLVKLIADEEDRLVGAHILAPQASELIAEMSLAVHKGLKIQDVASTVHVHPTLSEAVMEAAMKIKGKAIHVLNVE